MTILVPIMIFGWLPLTFILFMVMKGKKAALISLVLGWLFLPGAKIQFLGLPDYTKIIAICLPIILATLVFNRKQFSKLSPNKLDIPLLIFCLSGFASSISNGLGIYDGLSSLLRHILEWGFPYAIGKMYFSDREGISDLAMWIVIGGLIYIPFCIWEIRMSPNLHYYLYGFRTDKFGTTLRFGGYRPVVFLQHGLAVGIWLMSSLLMAIWLRRTMYTKKILGFSMRFNVFTLFAIFLLTRSLNSIFLFIIGWITYFFLRSRHFKIIVIFLAFLPITYIIARNTGALSSDFLVESTMKINPDRARSLYIRLYNEELLMEKAWHRPFLGWGGWGRNRVYNDQGEDISITDGLWILIFGNFGLVGLISLGLVLLLPTIIFWRHFRHVESWGNASIAPTVGFIVILPLYATDCLMNAFVNPVFIVASGAVLGWLATVKNTLSFNEDTPAG